MTRRAAGAPGPAAERAGRGGGSTRGRGERAPAAVLPAAPFDSHSAARAGVVLWISLSVLAVLHAAFALVPSMWGWSLNLIRFLPPATGWGLTLAATLALVPAVGGALQPVLERAGRATARSPLAAIAWAALAAGLVLSLPDDVRFVGDFQLRLGAVKGALDAERLFPQSLWLDPLIHHTLPLMAVGQGWVDAVGAARLLGALEAACLALIAVGFTRTLRFGGVAALAATAVVFFGGYLTLYTGYSKAFAEMCLLTAATGMLGLRTVREGRGLLPFGVVVALAFSLHRSALVLAPAAVVVWLLWFRAHGSSGGWKRPSTVAAVALPIAAVAIVLPRVIRILTSFDFAAHLKPTRASATAASSIQFADLTNLVIMLSPVALCALAMVPALVRDVARRRELAVLGSLAVPFAAMMVAVHPINGNYRDWDVHAAGGVSFSLLAAWLVGETLSGSSRHRWLALAVVMGAAAPSVQWLAHHTDLERGLERVEAFAVETPRRSEPDRASAWDFIGVRNYHLERWEPTARAFREAAALTPSPRILMQWTVAEIRLGNLEGARRAANEILERNPQNAWAAEALRYLARQDSLRAGR